MNSEPFYQLEIEELRELLRRGIQLRDKMTAGHEEELILRARKAWVDDVHSYFAGIGETAYIKDPWRVR